MFQRYLTPLVLVVIGLYIGQYVYYFARGMILIYQANRFEKRYFVGDKSKPKLLFVVMGDSTALGTGAKTKEQTYAYAIAKNLADQGHFIEVKNIAHNGADVTAVLDRQVPQLAALEPNVITLTVGANDVTHFTSTKEFIESLEALLNKLNALPNTQIIIANTPDMGNTPAIPAFLKERAHERSIAQNKIFNSAIQKYPFKTADLFTKGSLVASPPNSLYAADNFHPNDKGYAIWAKVFIEELKP